MKRDPYDLRRRAIEGETLSPREIGRAIYHLAQRRHFRARDFEEVSDTADDPADDAGARKATSVREQTAQALRREPLLFRACYILICRSQLEASR